MVTEQLEKLLFFYKKAVEKNLTALDFAMEMKDAEISLDRSFVETGKEDMNLGEYLTELRNLKQIIENE